MQSDKDNNIQDQGEKKFIQYRYLITKWLFLRTHTNKDFVYLIIGTLSRSLDQG